MKTQQKIGIMTLSAADNCGSLLQTYALKRLLENYGEVEIINFSSESSHAVYDMPCLTLRKRLKMAFDSTKKAKYQNLARCKRAYASFRKQQLQMDEEELFAEDLGKIKSKYDVVVAGSDQVWNVRMGDFDEAFFLGWTDTKKVAYAPSLGGRDVRLSQNAAQIIGWIKKFDFLSVREEIGKNCLEEVSGRTVEKVLDPTLVLPESEWEKLVGERLVKEDYIFYYSWAYCYDEQLELVRKESKRLNMPVVVIDSRKWFNKDEKQYGFILSANEGPLAFLNLMYYANHVYVESFHGMVFAYIFKKNFWLLDWHEDLQQLDSRLLEFVNLLSAHDRILTEYIYDTVDVSISMKYDPNCLLEALRGVSKKYIERALSI